MSVAVEKSLTKQPSKHPGPGVNRANGRPKGLPNKVTRNLREAIMIAAEQAGGKEGLVGYLKSQAIKSPTAFLPLLGKVLPVYLAGANGGPVKIENTHIIEVSSWTPERRDMLRQLLLEETVNAVRTQGIKAPLDGITYQETQTEEQTEE